mmetsp:Transcript_18667/g.47706  ORF Transcript_18667/g.47706 Transcript_18667/m.47706 type:complete len:321 (+) Transcript_18667:2618-3580(+)
MIEHRQRELRLRRERRRVEQPGEGDELRGRALGVGIHWVRVCPLVRRAHQRMHRYGLLGKLWLAKRAEVTLKQLEALRRGKLGLSAVDEEARVGRVIISLVERLEGLVRQRRDRRRVAARVNRVDGMALEHRLLDGAEVPLVSGRVDALHLVEDDALVREGLLRLGILYLEMPAFLLEDLRPTHRIAHKRVEAGVEIHVNEVEEVLLIATGDGVHGLVGRCHRIQESLERALEQLHERLLQRVLLAAAQHAVLEDVRHAGVVLGQRAEVAREDLVIVVGVDREHLSAGQLVAVDGARELSLGHVLRFHEAEVTCPVISRG